MSRKNIYIVLVAFSVCVLVLALVLIYNKYFKIVADSYQVPEFCGDNICSVDENDESCPQDCGENFIINSDFENDLENWNTSHYPEDSNGTEEIIFDGCLSGKCIKQQIGNSSWQGSYQKVENLTPGKKYVFSAKFKTTYSHYGHINIYDSNWGSSCGGDKVYIQKTYQGNGEWQEISEIFKIPETDVCGESTENHNWRIYLYSYEPKNDETLPKNMKILKNILAGTQTTKYSAKRCHSLMLPPLFIMTQMKNCLEALL